MSSSGGQGGAEVSASPPGADEGQSEGGAVDGCEGARKDAHHAEYLLAVAYAPDKGGNSNKDTDVYFVLTTTGVVKPWKGLQRLAGVGVAACDPHVFTTMEGWVRSYAARQSKGTLGKRPAINVDSDEEDAPCMKVDRGHPCKTPVKPHKQAAHTTPPSPPVTRVPRSRFA